VEKQLSVRDTEKLVKKQAMEKADSPIKQVDETLVTIENQLAQKLGTQVSISQTKNGKGKLVINFDQDEKLQEILSIFQS
jgi:ParB family chromosome partitioning protein